MVQFKATPNQVKEIAVNATKASRPVGMGTLHFDSTHKFSVDDFLVDKKGLFLDYVQGRMVKLNIWRISEDVWETSDTTYNDYQSWCAKYPTYQDLLKSVPGVEIL
jgi:hypothetical protein